MAKHVADKPHKVSKGARLKRYVEIDRETSGAHEQTLQLQQRPRAERNEAKRAKEYTRIERGRTA